MKILTANFVTCAVKTCKVSTASFPLHFKDAELEQVEMEYNPLFLKNVLTRVEWDALKITAAELGFTTLPDEKPEAPSDPSPMPPPAAANDDGEGGEGEDTAMATTAAASGQDEKLWRDLHTLLLETQVISGSMVCGNCGHEYRIKDGIANFLLPHHLV